MVSNILDNTENTIVEEKLLNDSKDKSNSTKQQHLNKLKTKTYIIYTVVVILATALSSIYTYYAVKLTIDSFNRRLEEYFIDFYKT